MELYIDPLYVQLLTAISILTSNLNSKRTLTAFIFPARISFKLRVHQIMCNKLKYMDFLYKKLLCLKRQHKGIKAA